MNFAFPWPPAIRKPAEDEDAGTLALRWTEGAIDAMTQAEESRRPEDWDCAADKLWQASWYCRFAAAPLYTASRIAQESAGLAQCSHCKRWRQPEDLERHATRLTETGEQAPRANTWLTCKGGCEESNANNPARVSHES